MSLVDRTVWLVERHPVGGALVVFFVQLGVRSPGLGKSALWLDESLSLLRTHLSTQQLLRFSATNENPPFYNLVLAAWVDTFGPTEVGARSLSLVASALAGVLLFLLARRFFSAESAILVSVLYLGSGIVWNYAQEARSYSLVLLLCVASFYGYFALLARPGGGRAALLAIVNGLAVYTHFTVVLALLWQLPGLLFLRPGRVAIRWYVASQVVAAALFAPWLPVVLREAPMADNHWLGRPGSSDLFDAFVQLSGGVAALALGVAVVVGGALVLAGRRGEKTRRARAFVLFLWGVVSILLSFLIAQWMPIFLPRYVLFALPGMLLLLAVMLESSIRRPILRWAAALLLAVSGFLHVDASAIPKPDWREVADHVRSVRVGGGPVFVSPPTGCPTFGFYFAPEAFAGPQRLVRRLRAQGVYCVREIPDVVRADGELWREAVLVLKPNSKVDVDALARDRGYRIASKQETDGVWVYSLRRVR